MQPRIAEPQPWDEERHRVKHRQDLGAGPKWLFEAILEQLGPQRSTLSTTMYALGCVLGSPDSTIRRWRDQLVTSTSTSPLSGRTKSTESVRAA